MVQQAITDMIESAKTTNTNLFEFYLLSPIKHDECRNSENVCIYDTCLSKEIFYKLMHKLQGKYAKSQLNQFKCNVIGEIYYCNNHNKDISIFSKRTASVGHLRPDLLCVGSNRKKLNILSFPSTQVFDNEEYIKTLTFKVSNRVSISLSQTKSADPGSMFYEAKASYNHDETVDKDTIVKTIIKTIQELEHS
jgi:hypothetical protein